MARARLLAAAGVEFTSMGPSVDESRLKSALLAHGVSPDQVAVALAEAKASAVSALAPGLVVGADQVLDLGGEVFDKPSTLADARDQLAALRGRRHQLHCAVAVADGGRILWRHLSTATLWMRHITDRFLDEYLDLEGEKLLGCVGCYRLEARGAQLFDRIEGDYFAILGLPLLEVLAWLRERAVVPS